MRNNIYSFLAISTILILGFNKENKGQSLHNFIIEQVYNDSSINTSMNYFDGLGRPIQGIQVAASPKGNDIIQYIEYDSLGRESIKYLPYISNYAGGFFRSNAENEQYSFYTNSTPEKVTPDNNPWAIIKFEESPLNRVLQQGAPGAIWQPKTDLPDNSVHYSYETNIENEVKLFKVNTSTKNLIVSGNYSPNTLYKNGVRDENGMWGYEYKDKQGQVILKVSDPSGKNLRTYYVYDDFGLLRYVIPPKAVENLGSTTTFSSTHTLIKSLCYYYEYDMSKRMTIKQLPGAEPVYLVYNKRDQAVLTQDGNLRSENKWMFTKYDHLNRPILNGIYQHSSSVTQPPMQTLVDANTYQFEEKSGNYNDACFGYKNLSSPVLNLTDQILSVTYYDDYGFDVGNVVRNYSNTFNTDEFPKSLVNNRVIGQVTGTLVKVINEKLYLLTVKFYDNKYRVLRTYSENYLGGYDFTMSKYDFIGTVLKTKQVHFRDAGIKSPKVINQRFEYDHAYRLTKVYHEIEGNSEVLLAEMEYNELGQLIKKNLHQTINDQFLQEVDFTYNIRGWLAKINDPASLNNDLFAMQLAYNDIVSGLTQPTNVQFNGNISAIVWKNKNEFATDTTHGYAFTYDAVNRITKGNHEYLKTTWTSSVNDYDLQSVVYDANGNIEVLSRYGKNSKHIDNLAYTYNNTNQLQKVADNATTYKKEGFEDGVNTGNDYAYDANGNLRYDYNKGITNIKYNYLNLPEEVDFGGGNKIVYIYTAGGVKVAKKLTGTQTGDRYYMGNMEYNNTKELEFIHTNEGRVRLNGSEYVYDYYLKDHLGNTRIVFTENATTPGLAEALQMDNYYPFGMRFNNAPVMQSEENNYLYNGKELQTDYNLDWYDYGARFYDAALGRWHVVDPLAEWHFSATPYNYCFNNPISFIDPFGLDTATTVTDDGTFVFEPEKKPAVVTAKRISWVQKMLKKIGRALRSYDDGLKGNSNDKKNRDATELEEWIIRHIDQELLKEIVEAFGDNSVDATNSNTVNTNAIYEGKKVENNNNNQSSDKEIVNKTTGKGEKTDASGKPIDKEKTQKTDTIWNLNLATKNKTDTVMNFNDVDFASGDSIFYYISNPGRKGKATKERK